MGIGWEEQLKMLLIAFSNEKYAVTIEKMTTSQLIESLFNNLIKPDQELIKFFKEHPNEPHTGLPIKSTLELVNYIHTTLEDNRVCLLHPPHPKTKEWFKIKKVNSFLAELSSLFKNNKI